MTSATPQSSWMNEDLQIFRSTVRRFLTKEFAPLQARWREQHRPDLEAWLGAGAAGLLLPDVPEDYGGGGGTFAHEAIVQEELAQAGVHFGSMPRRRGADGRLHVASGGDDHPRASPRARGQREQRARPQRAAQVLE